MSQDIATSAIYTPEQWNKIRLVVKTQHMKHYPKDFVTDQEADKIIAAMSRETVEMLYELAVKYGIARL